jgi:hypothetical protein
LVRSARNLLLQRHPSRGTALALPAPHTREVAGSNSRAHSRNPLRERVSWLWRRDRGLPAYRRDHWDSRGCRRFRGTNVGDIVGTRRSRGFVEREPGRVLSFASWAPCSRANPDSRPMKNQAVDVFLGHPLVDRNEQRFLRRLCHDLEQTGLEAVVFANLFAGKKSLPAAARAARDPPASHGAQANRAALQCQVC